MVGADAVHGEVVDRPYAGPFGDRVDVDGGAVGEDACCPWGDKSRIGADDLHPLVPTAARSYNITAGHQLQEGRVDHCHAHPNLLSVQPDVLEVLALLP